MSIATEIQRLQSAKADIKSAIENKGVTVGDGTIDTYAKFIDEIVSSGSGKNCVEGTITFTDTDVEGQLQVEHNMGLVPTLFLLLPDYEIDYTVDAENAAIIVSDETLRSLFFSGGKSGINLSACFETRASYGSYGAWFTVQNGELTDTVAKLPKRSASYDYRAGVSYKWIAWG